MGNPKGFSTWTIEPWAESTITSRILYVTLGIVHDSVPYLERLDRQITRFGFRVEEVALVAGYIYQGLKEREIFAVNTSLEVSSKEMSVS
jgi:hypothetical protein